MQVCCLMRLKYLTALMEKSPYILKVVLPETALWWLATKPIRPCSLVGSLTASVTPNYITKKVNAI